MIEHLKSEHADLRQTTGFALGRLCERFDQQLLQEHVQGILAALILAYNTNATPQKSKQTESNYAQDNILASIMRIIRYCDLPHTFELFYFWTKKLPLETDKIESRNVAIMFCDLLQNNQTVKNGLHTEEHFVHVLETLAKIFSQFLDKFVF